MGVTLWENVIRVFGLAGILRFAKIVRKNIGLAGHLVI